MDPYVRTAMQKVFPEQEFVEFVANSSTFAEHFFSTASQHLRPGGRFTYLTNEIDSLNFSMIGSVPPLNRPPAPNSPPRAPVAVIREKGNTHL